MISVPLTDYQLDRHDQVGTDIAHTILRAREMGELTTIKEMKENIKIELHLRCLDVPAYAGMIAEQFIQRNGQWFDRK